MESKRFNFFQSKNQIKLIESRKKTLENNIETIKSEIKTMKTNLDILMKKQLNLIESNIVDKNEMNTTNQYDNIGFDDHKNTIKVSFTDDRLLDFADSKLDKAEISKLQSDYKRFRQKLDENLKRKENWKK